MYKVNCEYQIFVYLKSKHLVALIATQMHQKDQAN